MWGNAINVANWNSLLLTRSELRKHSHLSTRVHTYRLPPCVTRVNSHETSTRRSPTPRGECLVCHEQNAKAGRGLCAQPRTSSRGSDLHQHLQLCIRRKLRRRWPGPRVFRLRLRNGLRGLWPPQPSASAGTIAVLLQSVEQRLVVHQRLPRAVHLLHHVPRCVRFLCRRADQLPARVRYMPPRFCPTAVSAAITPPAAAIATSSAPSLVQRLVRRWPVVRHVPKARDGLLPHPSARLPHLQPKPHAGWRVLRGRRRVRHFEHAQRVLVLGLGKQRLV